VTLRVPKRPLSMTASVVAISEPSMGSLLIVSWNATGSPRGDQDRSPIEAA
jgi:hypothetical protein